MRKVGGGDENFLKASVFGSFENIDNATDGLSLAVERELTDEEALIEVCLQKLTREDENSKGDR